MAAPRVDELSRVVGWINRLEWHTVFEKLFTGDVQMQQEAVDRINAWKCRFGDQMPVAIECTASLARAQIIDTLEDKADSVQLAYSIALIRFVNLITGHEQKGIKSTSVSHLARKARLPSWMVDLRHQAAHRFLPSLSVLREGGIHALSWLRREYWDVQSKKGHLAEEPEDWATDDDTKDLVLNCVLHYQREQFKELSNSRGCSSGTACIESSLVNLEELLTARKNARYIVTALLIQKRFFIPTKKHLTLLHVSKGYKMDNKNLPVLDTKLTTFWTPLLRLLHSLNITPLLLACLLRELAKVTHSGNKAYTFLQGWAVVIATEASRGPTTISSPGSKKGKKSHRNNNCAKTLYEGCKTIRLPWNDLVDICLESPNLYTISLLPLMLSHIKPKPTEETINNIMQLSFILTKPLKYEENKEPSRQTKRKKFNKKSLQDDKNNNLSNKNCSKEYTVSNDQSRSRTDDSFMSLESVQLQVNPEQDEGISHDAILNEDPGYSKAEGSEPVGDQSTPVHTAEEFAAMVIGNRKVLQSKGSLVGNLTQSAKDAQLLRKQNNSSWIKFAANQINWSVYPLGVLPGQPDDPDYFLLNIHEENQKKRSLDHAGLNKEQETISGISPKFLCVERVQSDTQLRKVSNHASEIADPDSHLDGMTQILQAPSDREIPTMEIPTIESSTVGVVNQGESTAEVNTSMDISNGNKHGDLESQSLMDYTCEQSVGNQGSDLSIEITEREITNNFISLF